MWFPLLFQIYPGAPRSQTLRSPGEVSLELPEQQEYQYQQTQLLEVLAECRELQTQY